MTTLEIDFLEICLKKIIVLNYKNPTVAVNNLEYQT